MLKPPIRMTGSEWADAHFWLSPESSASQLSKWKTLPYQKGILDAMTDPLVEKVTVKKSARIGYTKMCDIVIGYNIQNNPRNIMVVQPTIEDAQQFSKDEIDPMLRDIPVLRELSPEEKTRTKDSTILRKRFPGMTLYVIGANSPRGFRAKSAGLVVFDEVNGYPPTAGREGNQIYLGYRRADYYWDKKFIHGSTPTMKGFSAITQLYEQSDMRKYHVPCPWCGHMQPLEWSHINFSKQGTAKKPVYICAACEKAIGYDKHRWMMERGEWIAAREFDGHAGFQIWSAYSYSPNATWRHIVEAFQDAKDDREKLKTWVNTWLGEDSEEEGERLNQNALRERRESYGAVMPMGTALLTCVVDTQDDRLELLVKAWGKNEESWDIDHIIIGGNTSLDSTWEKLDTVLQRTWPHMNGSQFHIQCVLIDTGGHRADQVYAFVKTRQSRNVYAIKGSTERMAPIIKLSQAKRGKKSKASRYMVDLVIVGVNTAKDLVASRLQRTDPGPGFIHFPAHFSDSYFEQLVSEKRVTRYSFGRAYSDWVKVPGSRNEAWDLEVYSVAAVRMICPDVSILNRLVDRMTADTRPPEPPAPVHPVTSAIKNRKKPAGKGGFAQRWKL